MSPFLFFGTFITVTSVECKTQHFLSLSWVLSHTPVMVAATTHSLWSLCWSQRIEHEPTNLSWSLKGHKFEFCQELQILCNAIDKSKIYHFLHLLPTSVYALDNADSRSIQNACNIWNEFALHESGFSLSVARKNVPVKESQPGSWKILGSNPAGDSQDFFFVLHSWHDENYMTPTDFLQNVHSTLCCYWLVETC